MATRVVYELVSDPEGDITEVSETEYRLLSLIKVGDARLVYWDEEPSEDQPGGQYRYESKNTELLAQSLQQIREQSETPIRKSIFENTDSLQPAHRIQRVLRRCDALLGKLSFEEQGELLTAAGVVPHDDGVCRLLQLRSRIVGA